VLWILRWLLSVLAIGLEPIPAPLNQHQRHHGSTAPHPSPLYKALNAIPLHTMCAAGHGPGGTLYSPTIASGLGRHVLLGRLSTDCSCLIGEVGKEVEERFDFRAFV
jgi:hypothetical protein